MLAAHYRTLLAIHVHCVALSGSLFTARALMRITGRGAANHVVLRRASYLIDTILLGAAVALTMVVHQYPLVDAWLTVKVALLVLYVVLGSIALKRARSPRGRIAAAIGAWTTFAAIVGVAVTRSPASWFALLLR
ncbi:MAG: SirB2 family protein [Gammaproteobacteria bacterium]|nr:SirB2 family protein [Gammaproteobacteria bacterium]